MKSHRSLSPIRSSCRDPAHLAVLRVVRGVRRLNYQTAAVTRGAITQAVTATGTLNPVVNVQVGSQISGNIQKLFAILIPT